MRQFGDRTRYFWNIDYTNFYENIHIYISNNSNLFLNKRKCLCGEKYCTVYGIITFSEFKNINLYLCGIRRKTQNC